KDGSFVHLIANLEKDILNNAVAEGCQSVFHLHRLDNDERIADSDLLTGFDKELDQLARHRRGDDTRAAFGGEGVEIGNMLDNLDLPPRCHDNQLDALAHNGAGEDMPVKTCGDPTIRRPVTFRKAAAARQVDLYPRPGVAGDHGDVFPANLEAE